MTLGGTISFFQALFLSIRGRTLLFSGKNFSTYSSIICKSRASIHKSNRDSNIQNYLIHIFELDSNLKIYSNYSKFKIYSNYSKFKILSNTFEIQNTFKHIRNSKYFRTRS